MSHRGDQDKTDDKMSGAAGLRPPVVHLTGEAGAQALADYMAHLLRTPEIAIADYEGTRVMPYMAALGQRLEGGHSQNAPAQPPFKVAKVDYHRLGGWDETPQTLYDTKRLSGMFNRIAADTGAILLSEVGIVSEDSLKMLSDRARARSDNVHFFSKGMEVAGYKYQLGFIQCQKPHNGASMAFAVMALDKRIIERLSPDIAVGMLDSLSHIATAGNHDVLHHLTSPLLNENISVQRVAPDYAAALNTLVQSYLTLDDNRPDGYESWALVSHAATWREMRQTPEAYNLQMQTNLYYDAVERLNAALIADDAGESVRHKVIDYLSTIGTYALMRIVPMNDPLMEQVLTRIEKMSPSDEATLAHYMRERYRNPLTQYPERADLPDLQALYLELLERPGFITRQTEVEIAATLSQNVRYEMEKPPSARYQELSGAGQISFIGSYVDATAEAQREILRYMKALGQVCFDESCCDGVPEYRRIFVMNEMRKTRQQTVATLFRVVQSYLHRHSDDEDFEQNVHRLGLLHFDGLRRQANKIGNETDQHGLAYQTARNYKAAGHDILGPEGIAPSWRQIKMWDLIRTLPMIAYMGSPAADDGPLSRMHRISETVDRAVVNIVGGLPEPF